MDGSGQTTRRHRWGRWTIAGALAAGVLAVGGVATPASAYSGPPNFQTMGGGVGSTVPNGSGSVYASTLVGSTVYIGGDFDLAGGNAIGPVAEWTGTAWAAVGNPDDGPSGVVDTMTTDGTNLYVGGDFGVYEYAPGSTTWTDLGWSNHPMALAWYDDGTHPAHLVAAGTNVPGTACRFGSYDGANWTSLNDFSHSTQDCALYAMTVMDHVLYLGGEFTDKGALSVNNLIAYDGATDTWSAVTGTTGNGVDDGADTGQVYALAVETQSSTLVVGGIFSNASGTTVNSIAAYHAGAFRDIGASATNFGSGSEVDSVVVDELTGNQSIIAGGNFELQGGTTSLVSSDLGASDWSPGGTGTDGLVYTILITGPISLVIGGEFSTAYSIYDSTPVAGTEGVALFAPGPLAPTWNSPISITGTPKVGNVLTAHADVSGDPAPTVTYQWFRCDAKVQLDRAPSTTRRFLPSGCVVIPGATKVTYKVTSADIGKYLGVFAQASNIAGTSANLVSVAVPVPAVPATTTTTTVAPTTTMPDTTVPATSEPVLPATGGSPTVPWLAFACTGLGVVLLVPARRRWLR